jgi:hypothetical protein
MRLSVHTAGIPVIAVVDNRGTEKPQLLKAGAAECLNEPVDAETLCGAVRKHLAKPPVVLEAPAEVIRAPERVAALEKTGLLDSAPTESFDAITKLAAKLLQTPVVLMSLVDTNRQFFKSQVGLAEPWATARQTPLSHSFCQWVVSSKDELVVADARSHSGLLSNLAVRDLGVVAYAGVPLSTADGQTIGSFCAIDSKPRSWTEDELATLRDLAKVAEAYSVLEESRQAKAASKPANPQSGSACTRAVEAAVACATRVLQRGSSRMAPADRSSLNHTLDGLTKRLTETTNA